MGLALQACRTLLTLNLVLFHVQIKHWNSNNSSERDESSFACFDIRLHQWGYLVFPHSKKQPGDSQLQPLVSVRVTGLTDPH